MLCLAGDDRAWMSAFEFADHAVEDSHRHTIDVAADHIPDLSNSLPAGAEVRNPGWKRRRGVEMGRIP